MEGLSITSSDHEWESGPLQSNNQYFSHSMGKSEDNPQMHPSAKTRDSSTSDLSSRTLLCDAQYNRSSQISDHLNTATIWSSLELWWRDDVSLAWLCPLRSTGLFTLTTIRQSKGKPESVCDWRRRGPQTKWSWAHDDSATTKVSSDLRSRQMCFHFWIWIELSNRTPYYIWIHRSRKWNSTEYGVLPKLFNLYIVYDYCKWLHSL